MGDLISAFNLVCYATPQIARSFRASSTLNIYSIWLTSMLNLSYVYTSSRLSFVSLLASSKFRTTGNSVSIMPFHCKIKLYLLDEVYKGVFRITHTPLKNCVRMKTLVDGFLGHKITFYKGGINFGFYTPVAWPFLVKCKVYTGRNIQL